MVLSQDVPAGPGVKNLPADAEDTGSIPGPGRSHMPQSRSACVPRLQKPVLHNRRSRRNGPHTTHSKTTGESPHGNGDGTAKNK